MMQIFNRAFAIGGVTILAVFASQFAGADEKPMMKGVVAHEYGGPEVLKFENVPRPEPNENQALVRGCPEPSFILISGARDRERR